MTSKTTAITSQQSGTEKPRRDIHQQVTDTIIAQLEAGTAPWHKPWIGGDFNPFRLPVNARSGKSYQGVNILLLWSASINSEYASNEWCSFKQWSEQKESIRKGEKGSMIVYYDTLEKEVEGEIKKIPFIKCSYVFNRCQLASYEPDNIVAPDMKPLVERLDRVEEFVSNTKAVIKHAGHRACYVPAKDEIHMPEKNTFIDTEYSTATENYYSTLAHELTHWTGNERRLERKKGKKFGDTNYAEEELIAELGAAFLCAELEITNTPRPDHASYIAHWLEVLKQNKYAIIGAASQASKAVDYMFWLQP